ncbi:sensor domain-containing diguanylate cyclase [Deinococcus sp. JMULE3]|uniref:sensor domain-containing diguanylate cyclase n=1 Tax=Deinococcus sp. JMULE3 TaxID=2518341 RepID=UPI0015758605|nr:sensor domain-containing diguanylate cyclase [Deinococcus sp. JMULE3]NTX98996.1 sensor domain-containing diguanylate cyclase [Deinococcus sp. JMULE3]
MSGAPLPPEEAQRLMALAYYGILDTPREPQFDRVVRLAAHLLRTPVATINFIDQARQWSKASVGLNSAVADRRDSFCAWTILHDHPTVIENAQADPRFATNPMVTGDPHIHMYAGAPLIMPSGQRIGTLCVTDHQPHPLSPDDLQALQDLASIVVNELELRAYQQRLSLSLSAQREHSSELQRSLDQAQALSGVHQLLNLDLEPRDALLAVASLLGDALDADQAGVCRTQGDEVDLQVSHVRPDLPVQHQPAAPGAPAAISALGLNRVAEPRYVHDLPALADRAGVPVSGDITQVAVIPAGRDPQGVTHLIFTRRRDHPVPEWRPADRSLLEATGRAAQQMLDHHQARAWARRDALTGILNRRAFEDDYAALTEVPFTLALLDLDGLKHLNDTQGHAQGDKLLRIFAAALAAELGRSGAAYRYGGDEFVVIADPLSEDHLLEFVDAAVLATRQLSPLPGVSVGVAHSGEARRADLLDLADARMYGSKRRRAAQRA